MNADDVISVETSEDIAVNLQTQSIAYQTITKRSIDGDASTYAYIIAGASLIIPKLTVLLQELIKARKSVKVSIKGVTIQGVSEKNLFKIIELVKGQKK